MMDFKINKLVRKILSYYQRKRGLFSSITIETFGHCDNKCNFCFNSSKFPNREEGIMDLNLWKKVIDELSNLKFAGRISPHFYGEPLLDKRLPKLIEYARKKCPYAYIRFSSNGNQLNEKTLNELIKKGLDKILITNYKDSENKRLVKLYGKYPQHILYRNYKEINLVNRAGKIFDKNSKVAKPCYRPSQQLVINWKGNVLLCCNDYYEDYIFGNVKNESLLKIWNCGKFKKYRDILEKSGGRSKLKICRNCDL